MNGLGNSVSEILRKDTIITSININHIRRISLNSKEELLLGPRSTRAEGESVRLSLILSGTLLSSSEECFFIWRSKWVELGPIAV